MVGNNANNNLGPTQDASNNVPATQLLWRLFVNSVTFGLRVYVTFLVIIYQWAVALLDKVVQPFRPIVDEIQKVPKKDVSVEGILYQLLRLQFLFLLYVSPFFTTILHYILRPWIQLRDWAFEFVDDTDGNRPDYKRYDPTVLKEG